MSRYLLIILSLIYSVSSSACIISPEARVVMNIEKYFEESDVVFLGRLDESKILESGNYQIAEFLIIRTFKGEKGNRVKVSSKGGSSCSRAFEGIGTAYYIFAKYDKEAEMLTVGHNANFVSMEKALELNMKPLTELMHNKASQPTHTARQL